MNTVTVSLNTTETNDQNVLMNKKAVLHHKTMHC